MPDLEIDHATKLSGTMPGYAEQIVISTGKGDWTSRIEDDDAGEFVRSLRSFMGPKGKYSNPFHNVILTHSSFTPASNAASAFLFPSFRYIPSIPTDSASVETFVQGFVLPEKPIRDDLPQHLRQPQLQSLFAAERVEEPIVLICSHGTRDSRCGILGPLLQAEFTEKMEAAGFSVNKSGDKTAKVGLISHVGGHKWAGNCIIYLPDGKLAETGIWYGRVTPEHVEGIVNQTIVNGNIIENLFRGGIDRQGNILRL